MKKQYYIVLLSILIISCTQENKEKVITKKNSTKIAFGSCGSQDNPLPVFDLVVKHHPDMFIFLGDNIYRIKGTENRSIGRINEQ